jgi:hypothetical protein
MHTSRLALRGGLLSGGLLMALLLPTSGATASDGTPTPTPAAGGCGGTSGVTVVVDFTDIGGTVEVGCATGRPATGRQALIDAGFTPTNAASGMICAIDSAPNPCPATFQGTYWSYWSGTPGAGWTAYSVGADSSHPAPGGFEGWRYDDGKTGPGVDPAAIPGGAGVAAPVVQPARGVAKHGTPWMSVADVGVVALVLVAGAAVARRRRATRAHDRADTAGTPRD